MKTPGFRISRRRFLGGVSVAAAGTFGYAHFIEAERLQTSHHSVPLWRSGEPLKLLHLSDLHASPVVSLGYIGRAIDRALEWKPDVICLTGDFITQRFDGADDYIRILRRLSASAPCFATLGNHDGGRWAREEGDGYPDLEWITRLLHASQITLLQNTSARCRVRGRDIQFVGVGDMWAEAIEPHVAFRTVAADAPTVLLSHNPDSKNEVTQHNWQLMLSGHTHGGQFRVPWLGATPFAPVQDKRFVAGLGRWNDRWIHVTKGIGSVFGVRINCPPEVSFLTLT
ncbi:MAG TPA: phosphodiesterase YaeI [Methylomirabilota bacterium]|nr:phosphodiesterase YaeI [Methylomirabilota bacterium]